jgi:Lrp/AsnC family leucine-responsive transcriptional regulator
MNYDTLLDIDSTDKKIIELMQKNPELTHSEIADKIRKSQPAIGARVIKLKRKHLITQQIGAEFKELDIKLARVDLSAKNVEELWNRFAKCPYIINVFKSTGDYNIIIEVAAPDVKTIDNFVDSCLRNDPDISSIRVNFVIDSLNPYIVPLSFDIEKFVNGCSYECGSKMTKDNLVELLSKPSSPSSS